MAREDKISKRRLRTSYFSTTISIVLVLYLLGFVALLIMNANKLSTHVKENISLTVMMKDSVKEADILQMQKQLDLKEYVKSTEYITREDAAEIMKDDLNVNFVEFLGYIPIPPSINVYLKADYATVEQMQSIENELMAKGIVKQVFYQENLMHLVNENVHKISLFFLSFGLLILIISIGLINNTIRLAIYSKRYIIKTMQLVGATHRFIRKPFIGRGILSGIIGALFAIILIGISVYLLQKQIPELKDIQDIDLFLALFIFVIFLGIIISWISTSFAVRKYLKIRSDQLF
jgi:cell division transport system permease protein